MRIPGFNAEASLRHTNNIFYNSIIHHNDQFIEKGVILPLFNGFGWPCIPRCGSCTNGLKCCINFSCDISCTSCGQQYPTPWVCDRPISNPNDCGECFRVGGCCHREIAPGIGQQTCP